MGGKYQWIGRVPIRVDYSDEVMALRGLAVRLADLGHKADAAVVKGAAAALGDAAYHLAKFTHEEIDAEVEATDPSYVRDQLEDVIAQLPAFHPSYKPAGRLRAALIRGVEFPAVGSS